MPILRAQKEDLVAKLTEELRSSRIALVFAYSGLNMLANDALRTRAYEGGAKIKMISNNLLRLILKNISRELAVPQKTLALAYGFEDEVIAAKTLVEFAKETETLEVLGGWVDGNFFVVAQIETLATLPSKTALRAQLVGRLKGLIGGLAYSLNFPIQRLAYVVEAISNTQSAEKVSEAPTEEPKVAAFDEAAPHAEAIAQAESAKSEKPETSKEEISAESSEDADAPK